MKQTAHQKKGLSPKQLNNLDTAIRSYNNRSLLSSAYPPVLFLELTRNCISRCVYCRKNWTNDPQYDMSREIFSIIIKDCASHAGLIDLRNYGESLMLSDFRWYLEQIADACTNLRITTTLGCGDKETLKSLVDHNVSVSVSLDAIDKNIYERYRRGVCFDTVMKNLRYISSEMVKKHDSLKGHLRIGIAPLYRDNLDQVDGILTLAHQLHIPEIRILQLSSAWYDLNTLYFHKKRLLITLHNAIEKAEKYGIEIQFGSPLISALKLNEKACDLCVKPWLYSTVMFNGTMRPCDWQIELKQTSDDLGNIRDGVESVWNGKVAQRLRRYHIQSRGYAKICKTCYRIGRYADHEHTLDQSFKRWLVTGNELYEKITTLSGIPKAGTPCSFL
ncbi:MAG: radical SAM protein [Chitinispirillaceae bacterium]|nr:radical SAM protein [Chitinispirillaceae bacterium]